MGPIGGRSVFCSNVRRDVVAIPSAPTITGVIGKRGREDQPRAACERRNRRLRVRDGRIREGLKRVRRRVARQRSWTSEDETKRRLRQAALASAVAERPEDLIGGLLRAIEARTEPRRRPCAPLSSPE